jgi:Mg2+ and Co2+ transporter CorA
MNVDLPHFGLGGLEMFWLLMAVMIAIVVAMIVYFHRKGWI